MQSNGNYNCAALPASGWSRQTYRRVHLDSVLGRIPGCRGSSQLSAVSDATMPPNSGAWALPLAATGAADDVHAWLDLEHVVPDEVRVNSLLAFGFLAVCLVNAVGLMLASFSARAGDFAVRRALGASRTRHFPQCLTETAVVGVLGGDPGPGADGAGAGGKSRQPGLQSQRTTSID